MMEPDHINIRYQELFSVKLSHKAYERTLMAGITPVVASTLFSDVAVMPDSNTLALFKRYDMDYRCTNDTLICFMRSKPLLPPAPLPQAPFEPFAGGVTLRFLLTVNTAFLNRSVVTAAGSGQVYCFSNQSNAAVGGCITQQVTGVDATDLKSVAAVQPGQPVFAVIDIADNGAVNPGYDLFGPAKQLLGPHYTILFKSNF